MKIAMIGLGDIAQKAYLPILTQLENVELVFCTRNAVELKRLAQQYRITGCYQDYRALNKTNIDAVMIHTSTVSHPEIARYFLQLGIPTFVDKPLADNAFDCEKLYELAEQKQVPLYMGFNRRFIPLYQQYVNSKGLRALRWEKNRFDLPGELRQFVFDDFIHPLDSVNVFAKNNIDDMQVITQFKDKKLTRLDVQWMQGDTLLHASMDRLYGVTNEVVSMRYENRNYQFDSFVSGQQWQANQQTQLKLADWTPMLTSKGFTDMINDWLQVVALGKLDSTVVNRNLSSHQLAEAICHKISKQ